MCKVLRRAVPAAAVYNGDIPPDNIQELKVVLDSLIGRGGGAVPQLPGHTKIGTLSIPSQFLQPSGFARLLALCMSEAVPVKQSAVFVTRLCDIYLHLAASVRQDAERCLRSDLFAEFMSLVVGIIKHLDALFSEQGLELKSAFVPHAVRLLQVVKQLRRDVDSQYALLKNRLTAAKDMSKLAEIEGLYRAATTVSERAEILERQQAITKGPAKAQVLFPACSNHEQLAAMFHRLLIPYAADKVEYDYMLTALFEKAHLAPLDVAASDLDGDGDNKRVPPQVEHQVHAFRHTKTRNVDLMTVVRLLPGFLRHEQTRHGAKAVSPDFTIQPTIAARMLCMLKVARLQGAEFPSWVAAALDEQAKVTPEMVKETDEANLSVYWLHILWQLRDSLTRAEQERVRLRLTAHGYKWFAMTHLQAAANVSYERPVFPGVQPWIDTAEPEAYMVFCVDEKHDRTTLIDLTTGAPYAGGQEILDPEEQHRAFLINVARKGGYLDGWRYRTEGRVFVWDSKMPGRVTALLNQFELLNRKRVRAKQAPYSRTQILAHVHTLSTLYAAAVGSVEGAIPLVQWADAKAAEATMARVKLVCRNAPTVMEKATFHVTRPDLQALLVQRLLASTSSKKADSKSDASTSASAEQQQQQQPTTTLDTRGDTKASVVAAAATGGGLGTVDPLHAARALHALGDYPRLKALASFKFDEKFAGEIDYVMDCMLAVNSETIQPPKSFVPVESKIASEAALATLLDGLVGTLHEFCAAYARPRRLVSVDHKDLADIKVEMQPVALVSARRRLQAQQDATDSAKALTSNKSAALVEWPQCPILLDDIVKPIVTSCGHTFEETAIVPWLTTSNLCPVCKRQVTSTSVNYGMTEMLDKLKAQRA